MALLQLPLPGLAGTGGVPGSRSSNSSFLSSASHVGVGRDHLRLSRFLGGFNESTTPPGRRRYCSGAPRADYRRNQGDNANNQLPFDRRQDGYRTSRSDSRQREFESKQDGSTSPRSDSRRAQGRSSNSQWSSNGGQNGYDAPWVDSRRNNGNDFNSQRNRQAGNNREGYVGRNGSRGSDIRGTSRGQGRGKDSGRNASHKTPNPITQTVTPRQSTSQFVSDRPVHRAPWEQGVSSRSSSKRLPEGTSTQKNILIERLQRMQAEVQNDDEVDDSVDDDFGGLDNDGGFRDLDDDSSARFDERIEKSAMSRIVEKLSNIPGSRTRYEPKNRGGLGLREGPDSTFGPKYGQPMSPKVGRDWSIPDHLVPTPTALSAQKFHPDTRFPWERDDDRGAGGPPQGFTRVKPPSLAELTLPEDELKRLRSLGILTRHRIKVGKLGVTNGIVESIQNEWRNSEIVRVKCEGPPAQNMKQTHETLEERTGGLVVWRAGGACLVYRGKDYAPPAPKGLLDFSEGPTSSLGTETDENKDDESNETDETDEKSEGAAEQRVVVPRINSVYDPELEREMEEILSTLGPRYDDWTGMKPVPVDADLLVGPNAKFKKPFRVLPYGVKRVLSNVELTNLRRLARPIPPQFVLGMNRGLDGLAAAIVKFWEKSEIAKIAVKRGVQNTNHERMAEHLKRLTGGVVLARDKFFIVLYRGKDFLPPTVAAALEERQAMTSSLQEEEERLRLLPHRREVLNASSEKSIAGTLAETLEAKAHWEKVHNSDEECKNREEASKAARRDMARRIHRKFSITLAKKTKAEWELQKVEKSLRPASPPLDRENITDEERHMFGKLGLKMHAFLLLGRRGIFGGTVENMHLHWKHRQLVKVIYKARDKIDLEQTARMLEYESGGILVATAPTNKGQAIIMYRGKNYQRPPELRPRTLLTKRQALKRSIEMQRQKALTKHLSALEKEIEYMKADLTKLEDYEGNGSSDLIANNSSDMQDESIIFSASNLRAEGRTAVAGLARAICTHFQTHALVKVGVSSRFGGTPVEEILYQLEVQEATGAKLISQEAGKVILYRGWPEGQERPTEGNVNWEDLPPELRSMMISEVEADDDYLHESDWDESGDEDEGEIDEQNEDEKFLQPHATMVSSEVDDDSVWDEFDEDEGEEFDEDDGEEFDEDGGEELDDDDSEGDYRDELDLGLEEDELPEDSERNYKNELELGFGQYQLPEDSEGNYKNELELEEDELDDDQDEDSRERILVSDAL